MVENNPYYHELTFTGIDPVFIRWAIGALLVAILLTAFNTAEKPISWRCRGIKPEGKRARAARRIVTTRLADVKKDRKAIVLPSSSWDKELAFIVTGITLWEGAACHGKGLYQFFRNSEYFYAFAEINWLISVTIATAICYALVKKILRATMLIKVCIIAKWYQLNGVEIPPVIEKWGAFDLFHRISVSAKKAKEKTEEYKFRAAETTTEKESGKKKAC